MKNKKLCTTKNLKELMMFTFHINESEYELLDLILQNPKGRSIKELVEITNKDRTTIQKNLSRLKSKNLVNIRQINMDRGFMFIYNCVNKMELISQIEIFIDTNYLELKNHILELKKNIIK